MKRVVVNGFGGPEVLETVEEPDALPGPGEVRVRLTSIGMNQADLMARRGEYKLASGEPPFTPGVEGGGVIDAVGSGVRTRSVGQRVILGAGAPRRSGPGSLDGTYRTSFVTEADQTVPAPDTVPDDQLGALWLTYLTAWGCLIWKQNLQPGQTVVIPAASSGVGLAAAQIVRRAGGVAVGLTSSPGKAEPLRAVPGYAFDHLLVTHDADRQMRSWHREILRLTGGQGAPVFFDPVGAGAHLDREIRALAKHGTIWIYGLLGETGPVDVSPIIRKYASIRGWLLNELVEEGGDALEAGYRSILEGFETGELRQHVAERFPFSDVQRAHAVMEQGRHIGKMVLIPG